MNDKEAQTTEHTVHKSKYKQKLIVSCQQHSRSRQTMTLKTVL